MRREDLTGQHTTNNDDNMRLRRTTLADGRYMIFYTFDETPGDGAQTANAIENNSPLETDSQPITPAHAEEERQDV